MNTKTPATPAPAPQDPKRFTWSVSSVQRRSQTLPTPAGSSGK